MSVASAESLRSAVEYALETNPELAAIRSNRNAIDYELDAARGLYLPSLDVRAENGRTNSTSRTGTGIISDYAWHHRREISGVLSQRIFDGSEALHEVARHRNRVESARHRVADTANSIALRAVQAYIENQRSLAVLEAAKRNLASLRAIETRVGARVAAGKGTAGERSEAAARVASAISFVAEATNRVQDSDALYRAVVGRPPQNLQPVSPPRKQLPSTVDQAVAQAKDAAPSVIATHFDSIAAEAAVGTATSRLFPRLNFEATATRTWGGADEGSYDKDARAMFVVRWNLLNGGIDKARIYEAKARAIEAAEINTNTTRIVEREVRVSWNAVVAADTRVPALTRELDANRQTRETYSKQFDSGQRLLLDLLQVQNDVFVAEAALHTERHVGAYNVYRVLAGTGRLVEALSLEAPSEATEPPFRTLVDSWRHNYWNWATVVEFHRQARPDRHQK